jgi:YQGE family putative transporter
MSSLEKRTVVLNSVFNFGNTLAGSFLSVYLYVYTGSLLITSLYSLVSMALHAVFFVWADRINRKKPLAVTFACGLFLFTVALVYALLGQEQFAANGYAVLIVAAIQGVGSGCYWYSSNAINQIASSVETRARFQSASGIASSVTSILAPYTATQILNGAESELTGYRVILETAAAVYLIVFFLSLGIDKRSVPEEGPILPLLPKDDALWRTHEWSVFLYGLKNSLALNLTSVLIYQAAGSGGVYSRLNIVFALFAIVSHWAFGRLMSRRRVKAIFTLGTILTISSMIVLALFEQLWAAVFFGVGNAIAGVLYDGTYNYISANLISTYPDPKRRVVGREVALQLGRCAGLAFIILCWAVFPQEWYFKVAAVALSFTPVAVQKLMLKCVR